MEGFNLAKDILANLWRRWPYVLAAALGILLIGVVLASAHSFYDWDCCSDRDCQPVAEGMVAEESGGYRVLLTNQFIDRNSPKVRMSPDGRWHVCTLGGNLGGSVLCLYVPGRGS
jgi:hypothetical protein